MATDGLCHVNLSLFRSYQQLSLPVNHALVVFYGPNGVGKTNLLEAVSILDSRRGLRRAAVQQLAYQEASAQEARLPWVGVLPQCKNEQTHTLATGLEATLLQQGVTKRVARWEKLYSAQ